MGIQKYDLLKFYIFHLDKIKENLSLYLNQITMSNFATIHKKIVSDIDNNEEARMLFIELILTHSLSQPNQLPIIVDLLLNGSLNPIKSLYI